jgi:polyhydroxyalkanoate synthesis regulator phasin
MTTKISKKMVYEQEMIISKAKDTLDEYFEEVKKAYEKVEEDNPDSGEAELLGDQVDILENVVISLEEALDRLSEYAVE